MKAYFPVREIVFGLEDSIVSTLGVVVGISTGTNNRFFVILSALVVIVVESLSMAAGTYLSNKSALEIGRIGPRKSMGEKDDSGKSIYESFVMGVFYLLGGSITVFPFFFLATSVAIAYSIVISVIALFSIGYIKGKFAHINPLKSGLEMSLVSLTAAILGYLVGRLASGLHQVFPN